jgi:pyruvate formate lyase activating enzyme
MYFQERCRLCLDCVRECPAHAIQEAPGGLSTTAACALCGHCADVCVAEARHFAGRRYGLSELIAEIQQDTVFFDESGGGVTLSGGEPVSQPAFAAALLRACRELGIRTAIETCGFAQAAVFRQVALETDLVLFDLKLVDSRKHRRYTGAPNELILANLAELVALRRPVVVRIPVVPGVNDTEADVAAFRGYLGAIRPPAVELLPYHRIGADKYRRLALPYRLENTPEPAPADLGRIAETLARSGLNVSIGG